MKESEDMEPRANVSSSKLLNSSFKKYEEEGSVLTHEKKKSLGFEGQSSDHNVAYGYKLQDATLLSELYRYCSYLQ